jgi:tRNA pseudouridine38-40 synthase
MVTDTKQFDNFCKTKSLKENNDCLVSRSTWSRGGGYLRYDISANRFLHHMVRLLVGTMVAVLDGNLDQEHFRKLLNNRIKEKAKYIAPACGLYLVDVGYERGSL